MPTFLPGGLPRNVFAEFADTVHHDVAALVRFQTVDAAQECGFAAAGRTQQYDDFALFQVKSKDWSGGHVAVCLCRLRMLSKAMSVFPFLFKFCRQ